MPNGYWVHSAILMKLEIKNLTFDSLFHVIIKSVRKMSQTWPEEAAEEELFAHVNTLMFERRLRQNDKSFP